MTKFKIKLKMNRTIFIERTIIGSLAQKVYEIF